MGCLFLLVISLWNSLPASLLLWITVEQVLLALLPKTVKGTGQGGTATH